MKSVFYIALGGALGALSRYGISILLKQQNQLSFPVNTFTINVIGCLAIGYFAAHTLKTNQNQLLIQFVIIGLLGGFTTFSAFSLESIQLFKNGKTTIALVYIFASNIIGLTATIIGFQLHKVIYKV